MLNKLRNKENEGFTIIEVMIVLAIAGLILLIVFLAIPALQRNARNTQRTTDIGNLIGALNENVDNNNGTLPGSCTGATPCGFLSNAKTSQYGQPAWSATNFIFTNNGGTAPATVAAGGATDPADTNVVKAASYMTCNGTAAAVGNNPRSVAFVYDLETAGGTQAECRTAQ